MLLDRLPEVAEQSLAALHAHALVHRGVSRLVGERRVGTGLLAQEEVEGFLKEIEILRVLLESG